jgi:hypothetical protein
MRLIAGVAVKFELLSIDESEDSAMGKQHDVFSS